MKAIPEGVAFIVLRSERMHDEVRTNDEASDVDRMYGDRNDHGVGMRNERSEQSHAEEQQFFARVVDRHACGFALTDGVPDPDGFTHADFIPDAVAFADADPRAEGVQRRDLVQEYQCTGCLYSVDPGVSSEVLFRQQDFGK